MEREIRFVQRRLKALEREDWIKISKASGVPFSTVKKIGYGQTQDPRDSTVGKIAAEIRARDRRAARAQPSRALRQDVSV